MIAYGTWAISVVLFALVTATGEVRILAPALFTLGVAATATTRTYFVEFSTMVRQAYEFDRESIPTLPRRR